MFVESCCVSVVCLLIVVFVQKKKRKKMGKELIIGSISELQQQLQGHLNKKLTTKNICHIRNFLNILELAVRYTATTTRRKKIEKISFLSSFFLSFFPSLFFFFFSFFLSLFLSFLLLTSLSLTFFCSILIIK